MSANEIPVAGTRETLGDTLILFALLALLGGLFGHDGAVFLASGPLLIGGLLLRRGRGSARLLSIPIPVPKLPTIIVVPLIAILVVATRWIVLS
jgi:hypothetical protein